MKRFDVLKEIIEVLDDQLVICNIGIPSKELYHLKDRNENFYMLGSMGLVSSIALGVALAKPTKRVWCIDGDGSILMNLGSLSTIGNLRPRNLTLIIIDNGSYGSTGDQRTHTSQRTKLDIIAEGAGFDSIIVINQLKAIIPELKRMDFNCNFVLIKAKPGNADVENIPLNPAEIRNKFMDSM